MSDFFFKNSFSVKSLKGPPLVSHRSSNGISTATCLIYYMFCVSFCVTVTDTCYVLCVITLGLMETTLDDLVTFKSKIVKCFKNVKNIECLSTLKIGLYK
ncbi:UNVERIFIED_CONTAM: hypothetical protein RMT77_010798 [Armadillidium vulgare]